MGGDGGGGDGGGGTKRATTASSQNMVLGYKRKKINSSKNTDLVDCCHEDC